MEINKEVTVNVAGTGPTVFKWKAVSVVPSHLLPLFPRRPLTDAMKSHGK